ncbi:DUF6888 family protein [Aliterella atlantica]|uniref:DUF6888 family protein n=1 Tax=Aliterella atlantica TaxID=1827278 RepID=UPI0019109191|nr:hypothetical protein [Aliterella atlantica]
MPTVAQALECVFVCQMLSNLYRDIVVFRYEASTKEIYILTAGDIQIVISPAGQWRFI